MGAGLGEFHQSQESECETPAPALSREQARAWALEAGFDEAGLVALPHAREARDAVRFEEWVQDGHAGTMQYLKRTGEGGQLLRSRAGVPFPWARSAIVCFASYHSAQPRSTDAAAEGAGWIARYAWSSKTDAGGTRRPSDYHKVLLKRIKALEARIREARLPGGLGDFEARGYVDTGPVVERALATAAGLGWTGKNTCLIHPKLGSYGFLAVLLTSLEVAEKEAREEAVIVDPTLEKHSSGAKAQQLSAKVSARLKSCPDTSSHPETGTRQTWKPGTDTSSHPEAAIQQTLKSCPDQTNQYSVADVYRPSVIPDRCGSCTRCLDACPTGALIAPYRMDAAKCISYLTIEHRGPIAAEWMEGMGRQVFGCDICQDVCPWNRKSPVSVDIELEARAELVNPALDWLAAMDEAEFEQRFNGSPVRRAGFLGFRRNVAIAMGNSGLARHTLKLNEWAEAADEGLRAAARWALGKLS